MYQLQLNEQFREQIVKQFTLDNNIKGIFWEMGLLE
jgi:hypothetical protein